VGLIESVPLPKPVKFILNWGRRYSLWVMNFGLACCAIELIATSTSKHDFIRLGVIPVAHGPRQADLLVVAGTVTDKMAPALKRVYDQIPDPKYVISFGSCSNCGGPIDLAKTSDCSHCGSPLSMLDMAQAETLVAQLREADRSDRPVDPALPLALARARLQAESAFTGAPKNTEWLEEGLSFGLVGAGLSALVRMLKDDD